MQSNLFLVHRDDDGNKVHTIRLNLGDSVVGRSKWLDIPLLSDSVSRKHATISADVHGVIVRDLSSRNGTFVNNVRVRDVCPARPGDQIRIGEFVFTLTRDPNSDLGVDPSVETRDVRTTKKKPAPVLRPAVRKVFDCLTRGMTEKEIAEELHRSIHTVHNHVKTIYQEYEVKSKVELLFKVLPSTRPE
jgi:pSer/pThr/pTyr-binding forkhead associated (FHA) protein